MKPAAPTFQQLVILLAMGWSASMLTLGYLGLAKPDAAFTASVLGSAIGAAGIQMKDEKEKPPSKKTDDPGSY
jgi:uncharacterized membrane protein YjjB (DUF3815 family)